jgi:hypothetical protein
MPGNQDVRGMLPRSNPFRLVEYSLTYRPTRRAGKAKNILGEIIVTQNRPHLLFHMNGEDETLQTSG